ncbi:alpha/beta fold hydrolase [Agilicoccus flavus]|uniref:alpha/beta fold hydrolase n=1 Tax=Agilicoccus flavus TaxID=2775968 RepID=UPI001CF67945|nr:alpha/beta fold hydrolase [Agilicoccus flavus]
MNPLLRLALLPRTVLETTNILLTAEDAPIGVTPRDIVWTHRKTTLYRYRSSKRTHDVPILLVFALINRPMIYDLRPGNSFVEFLLDQGFDVFLLDWGELDDSDADMGLAEFVCDEVDGAVRETIRASGASEISVIGWCIGAALSAMYAALHPSAPIRNLVLLTMPVDIRDSLYTTWIGRETFDVDEIADEAAVVPGPVVDWANKLMKPVTNYVTTKRRLFQQVEAGTADRVAFQAMNRWVSDNPPFPSKAFREWLTWMYKENRLVRGRMELRGHRVDLGNIDHSVLVVTAGADHIAPRHTTMPFFDLVSSDDIEHIDRPGGHIGLMAGSKAKREIWPDIVAWLAPRSGPVPLEESEAGAASDAAPASGH